MARGEVRWGGEGSASSAVCFILLYDASVPIGVRPPSDSRGTDLSCHLTALLHQTDLSLLSRRPSPSIIVFVIPAASLIFFFFLLNSTRRSTASVSSSLIFSSDAIALDTYVILHPHMTVYARYTLVALAFRNLRVYAVWCGREDINFPIRIFFVIKGFNHFHGNVKKIVISIPAKYLVNIYGTFCRL